MEILDNENHTYSSVILDLLDGNVEHLKIRDGELTCCCPFHDDNKPSFAMNLESGLYYCHACSAKGNIVQFVSNMKNQSIKEAIQYLASKGHDVTDNREYGYYTLEKYAEEKNLDINYLSENLNLKTSENGKSIDIPYFNEAGSQIAVRHRNHPNSETRFYWSKGTKASLYGLQLLDKFSSEYVIFVEGESDCHCAWLYDIYTIGVAGAKNFKKDDAKLFDRFEKIYIHLEPDKGGTEFIKKICQCLPTEKLYTLSAFDVDNDCKDLADLHVKGKLNKESLLATAQKVPTIYLNEINQFQELSQHVVIAEQVLERLHLKFYKGDFYVYQKGVYKEGKTIIEQCLLSIDKNLKKGMRAEILDYLRILENVDVSELNKNVINVKNGIYNISTNTLEPHNPETFTVCQMNFEYLTDEELEEMKQNGEGKYIDKFFKDISSGNTDREDTLYEFTGYSMTYSTEFGKCLFIVGESAENGKSTFIALLQELFTSDNYCSVSIEEFAERFCGSELLNKLINIIHEVKSIRLNDIAKFKAVISGDEISVEEKYKARYTIKPFAHHIFAMNSLPELKNGDAGYFRRLQIVPFTAKFSDEEKENFNFDNLVTESSLNYLGNIALRKYLKMRNERRRLFSNSQESNQILDEYKNADENSASVFINNSSNYCHLADHNNKIQKTQLYQQYHDWCTFNHIFSYQKNFFYKIALASGKFIRCSPRNGYDCFEYIANKN